MIDYERSYGTGRTVASILEILSWIIVVLGVIVALAGFATGGTAGFAFGMAGRDVPGFFRIVALVPGVMITAVGLLFVMFVQQFRATLDSAEMTRDMLAIARRQVPSTTGVAQTRLEPVLTGAGKHGDRIKIYKGYEIRKHEDGVSVSGNVFGNVIEAERHVDKMELSSNP